jgi:hypothetical protein
MEILIRTILNIISLFLGIFLGIIASLYALWRKDYNEGTTDETFGDFVVRVYESIFRE